MNKIQKLNEEIDNFNEQAKIRPEFNDKKFGKLLKSGDKIKIINLITNKVIKREVERFDGIEYKMKGLGSENNLGHSGYSIIDNNNFFILINKKPILKIEKI